MYYFKTEMHEELLKNKTITWLSKKLDYTLPMLYNIFNRNIGCRKIIAFAIVKALDIENDIDTYFDYIEGK